MDSQKRKTSAIWRFFDPLTQSSAKFNLCKSILSYKGSTSNLKKHMQRKHYTVNLNTNELSNVHMLPPKPVEIDEDTPVIFLDSSNPAISQPQIANIISSIDPTPSTSSAATPFVAASSSKHALNSTPTQRYLKSPRKQSTMSSYVPKNHTK